MLDRKQYDIKMDKVHQEEIEEITKYLSKYIKKNADIRSLKVNHPLDVEAMEYIRNLPIPSKGRNFKEVADELVNKVFENQGLFQHPRYLSLVSSSVSPYALMGAILADIYNINVAGAGTAPVANLIEEKLIAYLASLIGYDSSVATGCFTSGGSLSNLTAMIASRENKLNHNIDLPIGVAYCSDQAHSSIIKGMKMMGLRKDQIKVIPTDEVYKIRLDLLQKEIESDVKKGLKPFLLVGSCGTTNTGSIDPFEEMSKIAKKYNMWFHIDGAYGGSIFFSFMFKNLAKGAELSDSFSWDTHKWASVPYSSSTVLCRDRKVWTEAFIEHPEYLQDIFLKDSIDGWDRGIEMSRPFRAAKLWCILQSLGTDQLSEIIDYSFHNAQLMRDELLKKEYWEIVAPISCAAINFRLNPKGVEESQLNEMTHRISDLINEEGYAYILTTTLRGKVCLRVCLINGNTTAEDIINTVEHLNFMAEKVLKEYQK